MTLNRVLTAKTREERAELMEKFGVSKEEVAAAWNGGKLCGQCKFFQALGGNDSGLNGTCSFVDKRDYTKPSDFACGNFERFTGDF